MDKQADHPATAKATLTDSRIVLENSSVRRVLEKDNHAWRTRSFARADGTDEVRVESAEFLILLMDGTKLGLDDYRAGGAPVINKNGKSAVVEITYVPCSCSRPGTPRSMLVRYALGEEPYLRKTLTLEMAEGDAVDRVEVERFRTTLPCDLGGCAGPPKLKAQIQQE